MSDSIEYELKDKLMYAAGRGGDEVQAVFIELVPPTGRITQHCMAIEAMLQAAYLKMKDVVSKEEIEEAKAAKAAKSKEENEEKPPMTADEALSMLGSLGEDMEKVVIRFRELFKIVALVDGEKEITSGILDRVSHRDLRNMIGEYAANFILISWR